MIQSKGISTIFWQLKVIIIPRDEHVFLFSVYKILSGLEGRKKKNKKEKVQKKTLMIPLSLYKNKYWPTLVKLGPMTFYVDHCQFPVVQIAKEMTDNLH